MIKTVILDLDDTLYDEIDYCKSGFSAVSVFLANSPAAPSAELIFQALWQQFTSGNHTKTFNTALDNLSISYDDNLIGELIKVYRNHTPKITLPADSKNVLSQLSDKYTLAMLTDGFLPAQQLKVQALEIEKFFKCIIYTEQLGRHCWKPSPAGFEKIIQTLNAEPAQTVYIADNAKKDFIAPNKLAMATIQLIRPAGIHTTAPAEKNAAPQHIINKIDELPALLQTL